MATLTIFANFFINDEEEYLRMQDSFYSFKDIAAINKWFINVRGEYKFETLFFLHDHLKNKLSPYLVESSKGWFYDSSQMLKDVDADFVMLWIEDHINLTPVSKYTEILNELKESNTEYMGYSFWHFGKLRTIYDHIKKTEWTNISTFVLDKENQLKIRRERSDYIISMAGIFSADLFRKIILDDKIYLRHWSKFLPLNFEKRPEDTRWLPVRYALPKYELFAPIDDRETDGSSLTARGLYPLRVPREERWRRKPIPITKFQIFFRSHIVKYIPSAIYARKVKIGNFMNRLIKYLSFVLRRQ